MRRLLLLVIVVVLALPTAAYGQTTRLYRLRPVSADEYIQAISDFQVTNDQSSVDFQDLYNDFVRRYLMPDPAVSFSQIAAVYPPNFNASFARFSDLALWNSALVSAWLKEHPMNLDQTSQFGFELATPSGTPTVPGDIQDYRITAEPRDFKGDGGHEWFLTLSITNDAETDFATTDVNYLLATGDGLGGYHILTFPLPWIEPYGSIYDLSNTVLHPQFFQKLSGGGPPVWIVTSDPFGYYENGYLYVITWQNGHMVDLTDSPPDFSSRYGTAIDTPYGAVLELAQSPVPNQSDIMIHASPVDNWGCQQTNTKTVRWNGTQWAVAKTTTTYADSAGCAWRHAESAMWSGNWQSAIDNYQTGFINLLINPDWPKSEMIQFIQFRLALAYILAGKPLAASVVATILRLQPPRSELLLHLYNILPHRPVLDAYPICLAAHDIFQRYLDAAANGIAQGSADPTYYSNAIPGTIFVGMTWNDEGSIFRHPLRWGPAVPDPNKAGCDISEPLLQNLQAHTFTRLQLPVDQLQSLGFTVGHTVSFDLNRDRQTEWLVWLSLDSLPLFFAPNADGQTYHVSDAPFRTSFTSFNGMIQSLPSDTGSALIAITNGGAKPNDPTCPYQIVNGSLSSSVPLGTFSLWRLQSGELVPMLISSMCDDMIENFQNNVFSSIDRALPTTIEGYAPPTSQITSPYHILASVTFTWNPGTQTYQAPSIVNLPDEPTLLPSAGDLTAAVEQAFDRNDYAAALGVTDHALLSACSDCTQRDYVNFHFLRATALELLHRNDKAIAEYLFVAHNATSRSQAILAIRHLEPIDF